MATSLHALLCVCFALLVVANAHSGHVHHVKSVYDIISSTPNLSILKAAVDSAKLNTLLKDPEFKGTVFAPTNVAFKDFLRKSGLNATFVLSNPQDSLSTILLYHAIPPVVASRDIPLFPQVATVSTFLNQTVDAYKRSKKIYIASYGSIARVVKSNIKAKKALVHIIDTVLVPDVGLSYPGCKSVAQIVSDAKLTSLVAAVKQAGLLEVLSNKILPVTLLAPTNAAFESLLKTLNTTLPKIDAKVLTSVLLYHVIPTPVPAVLIPNHQVFPTLNTQNLTSIVSKAGISFKGVGSTAKVVKGRADYFGCNVAVHVVDSVLLPKL